MVAVNLQASSEGRQYGLIRVGYGHNSMLKIMLRILDEEIASMIKDIDKIKIR